jgi:predicted RNase H-like nuclease (RuvC/YqgF family)
MSEEVVILDGLASQLMVIPKLPLEEIQNGAPSSPVAVTSAKTLGKPRPGALLTARTQTSIDQYLQRMKSAAAVPAKTSKPKKVLSKSTEERDRSLEELAEQLRRAREEIEQLRNRCQTYEENRRGNVLQQSSAVWKRLSSEEKEALNQLAKANSIQNGWQQLVRKVSQNRDYSIDELRKMITDLAISH